MTIPQIAYSIGARFGTSDSLGLVSRYATQALENTGYLFRLLVSTADPDLSVPKMRQLGFLHRALRRVAIYDQHQYLSWLADIIFDFWASTQLGGSTHLHAWGQGAYHSFRRSKQLGVVTVLERASSHMQTQQAILQEEYARFGLKHSPTPSGAVNRALSEFDLADHIIVPSDFVRQSFIDHNFPAHKLIVNPFGVDITKFQPGRQSPDKFTAVFAGQVSLRKGIPYLLEAWESLKWRDCELRIIGSVAADAREWVKRYQHHPTIRWINYMPNLSDYLAQASVFVFPTLEEGSALVTYMALACGLPLITTQNAGSVARPEQEGWIVPIRSASAVAQALEEARTQNTQRLNLSRAARQRAEHFTWEHYQQRLINIYSHLTYV